MTLKKLIVSAHLYFSHTDTPCVGICSTIYGDQICRGCFRHYQEIIDWNTYTQQDKLTILNSLNAKITGVMQTKIKIIDESLLKTKCAHLNIRIRPTWHALTWAHALLRQKIPQIQNLTEYGIVILAAYSNLSINGLIELIDNELYHVSHCSL